MLCCPRRSPLRASSRLPGKMARSCSRWAACSCLSFLCATLATALSLRGTFPASKPLASLSRNDRITRLRYHGTRDMVSMISPLAYLLPFPLPARGSCTVPSPVLAVLWWLRRDRAWCLQRGAWLVFCRDETFELFEPVLDEDQMGRRGLGLAFVDHHEALAVGRDVVLPAIRHSGEKQPRLPEPAIGSSNRTFFEREERREHSRTLPKRLVRS